MVSTPRRVALKLAFSSKPEADIPGAPDEALPGDLPALNIYHSSAVEGSLSEVLGAPNYSYRFAEAKFMAAFAAHGRTSIKLAMPEYYATEAALPPGMRSEGLPAAHLIFRSTEQIRLLKFAWNICCFAWEFDVLKDDTGINEHPFLNQKRMLSLCDEVWVPCSYTKAVLERHGIANVHVIPAPIETAAPQFSEQQAGECGVLRGAQQHARNAPDAAHEGSRRDQDLPDDPESGGFPQEPRCDAARLRLFL